MRCVIARFPFDLFKNEVEDSMKGIKPEPVTGDAVVISRRVYPVKQVGEVITRQDRRDFSSAEVVRALSKLGFTCRTAETAAAPAAAPTPLETASALLGTPAAGPGPAQSL
ncbi:MULTISPECIES: SCO5918 family protein [unclassified Streptomyces]|uniref:SCO5918 family protein n=1 Tax=unclassified Streptomyces TaxID=2593676 RepID=UPI0033A3C807